MYTHIHDVHICVYTCMYIHIYVCFSSDDESKVHHPTAAATATAAALSVATATLIPIDSIFDSHCYFYSISCCTCSESCLGIQ